MENEEKEEDKEEVKGKTIPKGPTKYLKKCKSATFTLDGTQFTIGKNL